MEYELRFLLALCLTVISELALAFSLKRVMKKRLENLTSGRLMLAVMFASCLTLPYVWFVAPFFLRERNVYMTLSELIVFLVEAGWYRFSLFAMWRYALMFSFFLNFFSVVIGKIFMG